MRDKWNCSWNLCRIDDVFSLFNSQFIYMNYPVSQCLSMNQADSSVVLSAMMPSHPRWKQAALKIPKKKCTAPFWRNIFCDWGVLACHKYLMSGFPWASSHVVTFPFIPKLIETLVSHVRMWPQWIKQWFFNSCYNPSKGATIMLYWYSFSEDLKHYCHWDNIRVTAKFT